MKQLLGISSWQMLSRLGVFIRALNEKSQDEGAERYRKAIITAAMNLLGQSIQLMTGLLSVPLTLNYVGAERFGAWMTLSTALTFINFSDFGIGIGVQDRMSQYIAQRKYEMARKAFLTSLTFAGIIFLLLLSASEILLPRSDLPALLSLKSAEAIAEVIPTTRMVVFILALGLISGIVQRAFNALQAGFWVAIIQMGARVCSLLMLLLVVYFKKGMPNLVFAVGGVPSVAMLICGLPLLFKHNKWIWPDLKFLGEFKDAPVLKEILSVGAMGLGAAIAIYLVNNSIPVVIAAEYGAEGAADYAVLLKLISIPGLLLTYSLMPLWPAISEAKVKNDLSWVRKAYRKCVRITLVAAAVIFVSLLCFGQVVIFHWTSNSQVVPSLGLIFACGTFMVVGFWNSLNSVILNGLAEFKGQATYGLALAVIFVFLASIAPREWSKAGPVWVITTGFVLRCILMQWQVTKLLRKDCI